MFDDEIREGSFRGVPFVVRDRSRGSGRRGPTVERPNRDDAQSQDLGRKVRVYNINALVMASDGFSDRDRMLSALEKPGPGTFVDPFGGVYAERWVKVTDYRETQNFDQGGVAQFSITFEEVDENEERGFTRGLVDTSSTLVKRSSALALAAKNAFILSYVSDGMPGFVRQGAASAIGVITDQVGGQVFTALGVTSTMSDAIEKIGSVGLTAISGGGVDIADGLQAGFSMLSGAVPDLDDGLNGFLSLGGYDGLVSSAPAVTGTRIIEATNTSAIGSLVRRTAISAAAELLPKYSFVSYNQARDIAEKFVGVIDAEMDRAGGIDAGQADGRVFAALADLRPAVIDHTQSEGSGKARVINDTPWRSEPAFVTAHRLYGDASRASEIIARNGISHPNQIAGGSAIEVLDE